MGEVRANGPGLPKIANGPGRTNLEKMARNGPNRLIFSGPGWAEENFERAGPLILRPATYKNYLFDKKIISIFHYLANFDKGTKLIIGRHMRTYLCNLIAKHCV